MNKDEFEKIVAQGIEAIPEEFISKMNNVVIVAQDRPTAEQMRKLKIRKGWTLFGLYEGVSQLDRGINYGGVLPDKITIFREPIEESARSLREIKEIVKDTVWHEVAHHFGFDEKRVRKSEENRQKKTE
ncbi:MAG: metallopeptidase family protein [Candidatus Paceibacterota bacterium]|jgi:predicted Zn-dependent protease with MMP-like domain